MEIDKLIKEIQTLKQNSEVMDQLVIKTINRNVETGLYALPYSSWGLQDQNMIVDVTKSQIDHQFNIALKLLSSIKDLPLNISV